MTRLADANMGHYQAKFQNYMYGGRPLGMFLPLSSLPMRTDDLYPYFTDVRFNDRWHTFTPSAAKGGQIAPMAEAV
jgi:hypothetical protein